MKKFIRVIKVVVMLFFLHSIVQISSGYIDNSKEIKDLKMRIVEEELTMTSLEEEKKLLKDRYEYLENPKEFEKIAREVLNLRKEGEEVYRVVK